MNIASRIQSLAASRAILATGNVVQDKQATAVLAANGLTPVERRASLRGIVDEMSIFEIP